jgi:hypothetical protein
VSKIHFWGGGGEGALFLAVLDIWIFLFSLIWLKMAEIGEGFMHLAHKEILTNEGFMHLAHQEIMTSAFLL